MNHVKSLFKQTVGRFVGLKQGRSKGQIFVIVALSLVGLIAVVGLAMDVGLMFIENARLRRAVDAAALAAALQYREGYRPSDLAIAALEMMAFNGVNDPTAILEVCDPSLPTYVPGSPVPPDPALRVFHSADLCTNPRRKLVRVIGNGTVQLVFLPVIGLQSVPIRASATSETASVDLVLVIDTSESMTWGDANNPVPMYNPMRDPTYCNYYDDGDGMPGECHPFEEVKEAAVEFIRQAIYFPFDRVAVITFDKNAAVRLGFADIDYANTPPAVIESTVINTIKNLRVFEAEGVCPQGRPCRKYRAEDGAFDRFLCGDGWQFPSNPFDPSTFTDSNDPSLCPSTNVGAGMLLAGNQFATPPVRQDALWAVILLGDGAANGGQCPRSTWGFQEYNGEYIVLFCRDGYAHTRHCADPHPERKARCLNAGGVWDPENYDADDYA
ncbi:MAG: pilus assembly protein TadG-related protein, partial [Anaerolineales bacterium]|nr:pilus assembly protein TadG-related protein [Anaerolineales bacterium]